MTIVFGACQLASGEMNPKLIAENLAKRFGPVLAADSVSLSVASGEVVGLLGPNGAGKTTTLRMLAGILTPTAGRVRVNGIEMQVQPLERNSELVSSPVTC